MWQLKIKLKKNISNKKDNENRYLREILDAFFNEKRWCKWILIIFMEEM